MRKLKEEFGTLSNYRADGPNRETILRWCSFSVLGVETKSLEKNRYLYIYQQIFYQNYPRCREMFGIKVSYHIFDKTL